MNDMAELNIDAALVAGKKLVQTKEALVQLQVGALGMGRGSGASARVPSAGFGVHACMRGVVSTPAPNLT